MIEGTNFKGTEMELHRFSGARVLRVVHPERQDIDEHRHDWAYIGLYTLGRYCEVHDGGEVDMAGPSAVFHPPGRPHADVIDDVGLETLTIEFDARWLRFHGFGGQFDRSRIWQGGSAALAARDLAAKLSNAAATESEIGRAASRFLQHALGSHQIRPPAWLETVVQSLRLGVGSTAQLCRQLDLHPAWLARAYRYATGEGLHETTRRLRVERASALLRKSDMQLADVALASGFCDQSHMNRCFRALLGRSPLQLRNERIMR